MRRERMNQMLRIHLKIQGFSLAALLTASLLATGQNSDAEPSPARMPPHNVVVVVIDTLRADHLGLYGYDRPTSPFLDEWARDAVVFDRASSAAPLTFPSVNVLLSGRAPQAFYQTSGSLAFPDNVRTLAEYFAEAGYETAAISSSPIVRRSPNFYTSASFERGFASFDESCHAEGHRTVLEHTSPCVTDRVLAHLEQREAKRPLLLYVHYLDPHGPYSPPPAHDLFSDKNHRPGRAVKRKTLASLEEKLRSSTDPNSIVAPTDVRWLMDLYDGEIHSVDAELRRLTTDAKKFGLDKNTLWLITADHGESFLEHPGAVKHGNTLYETEIHVPLLLRWPERWPQGRRVDTTACGVDVTPTLLALSGIAVPPGLDGKPLFEEHGGAVSDTNRECISQRRKGWGETRAETLALRRGTHKAIVDVHGKSQLFNLEADPGEQQDLSQAAPPPKFAGIVGQATDRLEQQNAESSKSEAVPLDPDVKEALRALGYLETDD